MEESSFRQAVRVLEEAVGQHCLAWWAVMSVQ